MATKREIEAVLIDGHEDIRTAIRKLAVCGKHVLFVREKETLAGSLTDGDISKFLLKDGKLESTVREAANSQPHFLFDTERERAEQYVWDHKFSAVPIVDEDRRILDIVFLHDSVDSDEAKIRVLEKKDMTMVMEFFDQMSGSTRAMFNRGDVNRVRVIEHLNRTAEDNQLHFAAVVNEADGREKMVGYVFLWDLDTKIPWLGIAVREDWKGHHLGRRLLQHLDDWLKPRGYGGVMLTSVPANVRAHSLYTRMGFDYYGVYPDSEFLYIKRYEAEDEIGRHVSHDIDANKTLSWDDLVG